MFTWQDLQIYCLKWKTPDLSLVANMRTPHKMGAILSLEFRSFKSAHEGLNIADELNLSFLHCFPTKMWIDQEILVFFIFCIVHKSFKL